MIPVKDILFCPEMFISAHCAPSSPGAIQNLHALSIYPSHKQYSALIGVARDQSRLTDRLAGEVFLPIFEEMQTSGSQRTNLEFSRTRSHFSTMFLNIRLHKKKEKKYTFNIVQYSRCEVEQYL